MPDTPPIGGAEQRQRVIDAALCWRFALLHEDWPACEMATEELQAAVDALDDGEGQEPELRPDDWTRFPSPEQETLS